MNTKFIAFIMWLQASAYTIGIVYIAYTKNDKQWLWALLGNIVFLVALELFRDKEK